jgi:hypothetical protein
MALMNFGSFPPGNGDPRLAAEVNALRGQTENLRLELSRLHDDNEKLRNYLDVRPDFHVAAKWQKQNVANTILVEPSSDPNAFTTISQFHSEQSGDAVVIGVHIGVDIPNKNVALAGIGLDPIVQAFAKLTWGTARGNATAEISLSRSISFSLVAQSLRIDAFNPTFNFQGLANQGVQLQISSVVGVGPPIRVFPLTRTYFQIDQTTPFPLHSPFDVPGNIILPPPPKYSRTIIIDRNPFTNPIGILQFKNFGYNAGSLISTAIFPGSTVMEPFRLNDSCEAIVLSSGGPAWGTVTVTYELSL